jgi:predicted enzyme related to lactoylglutathione lyase
MITGIHALLFSRDADATRAFFRDALGFGAIDAGRGWLIFALPPAELGIHPTEGETHPDLYLMCDDVERTAAELESAGAEMTQAVADQPWGRLTTLRIPGGVEIGLYAPRHPTALALAVEQAVQRRDATGR